MSEKVGNKKREEMHNISTLMMIDTMRETAFYCQKRCDFVLGDITEEKTACLSRFVGYLENCGENDAKVRILQKEYMSSNMKQGKSSQ